MTVKHPIEDEDSFEVYLNRPVGSNEADKQEVVDGPPMSKMLRRQLKKHHHKHHGSVNLAELEAEKEAEFWQNYQQAMARQEQDRQEANELRQSRIHEMYRSSGIAATTVHGLMIDAGSTGSRLHVYEWTPRILHNAQDIQDAVSGNKLSFPGTESRWTERLQPGLADFAKYSDEDLIPALIDYLSPLIDFAKAVLHTKSEQFGEFPIFLRATAGMRILPPDQRARVIQAVRQLFHNTTFCPFAFSDEHARVLSGEEEAIYDWAGVNFLMGDLISQSEGAGTVVNPIKTHGALDLGGGSTQISFYENNEDIMSNLFKLQIGQAKHWNVYAHSFLFYGMNEAINRFQARLVAGKDSKERLVQGIYNPCLPGGARVDIRTNIHLSNTTMETWNYQEDSPSHDGYFQAVLRNDEEAGDPDLCLELAKDLLHLEQNQWCDFAHKGDCSLAGVYQPRLPKTDSESFCEFLAFSNYHHVWKFLQLPDVASIAQLEAATRQACAMSHSEVRAFAKEKKFPDDVVDSYCFRSAYVFQLLHNGFGFRMNDTIRATNVINGHKVGWALGAMLYEINAMPWRYEAVEHHDVVPIEVTRNSSQMERAFLTGIVLAVVMAVFCIFTKRHDRQSRTKYRGYEVVKDVE